MSTSGFSVVGKLVSHSIGSEGADPCCSFSIGYSVVVQVSTVSPGFLSLVIQGYAKTTTQHANTATHNPIISHILPLPPDAGVFCGDAFELSAYCGLDNNSESKI